MNTHQSLVDDLATHVMKRLDPAGLSSIYGCAGCGTLYSSDVFAECWREHVEHLLSLAHDELEQETDAYDRLITKQGATLTRAAVALRGPTPPLTTWSHHDVGELAENAMAKIARLTDQVNGLEDENFKLRQENLAVASARDYWARERDDIYDTVKDVADTLQWESDILRQQEPFSADAVAQMELAVAGRVKRAVAEKLHDTLSALTEDTGKESE